MLIIYFKIQSKVWDFFYFLTNSFAFVALKLLPNFTLQTKLPNDFSKCSANSLEV